MTEQTVVTVLIALVAAVPPTVTATFAYLASKRNHTEIKDLRVSVDGRLTDLLASVSKEQHAAGRVEGIENERDRAVIATHAQDVAKNVESIATDIGVVKDKLTGP